MKIGFRRSLTYGVATLSFCLALLLFFMLNPVFLYAKKTEYNQLTIYHTQSFDEKLIQTFEASLQSLEKSDVYDTTLKLDICLDDGSVYPQLIEALLGEDIIRSFANKSVFHCVRKATSTDLMTKPEWGADFRVSQWLTHSFVHCLQCLSPLLTGQIF